MPKTDIEILSFVDSSPEHQADAYALRGFIGENADRRISDMLASRLLKVDLNWFSDRPAIYSLDASGDRLLADHQQRLDDEIHRRADQQTEKEIDRLHAESLERRGRMSNLTSAILGAIVGALLTFLLDHHTDVAAVVHQLLGLR